MGETLEPDHVAVKAPELPGPFAVGRYAKRLQEWMRERPRVLLIGEVTGVGRSKVQAYFELRDGEGAVPCAIWLNDLERAGLPEGALRDGAEVVIAGGLDYYPGGGAASKRGKWRATRGWARSLTSTAVSIEMPGGKCVTVIRPASFFNQ